MEKPNAYIETTIPNFYYDTRPDPEMVARRVWTREWWETAHTHYELVSSDAVVEELEAGTSDRVPLRMALLKELRVLKISPAVLATVQLYMRHKLMPAKPSGDAFHLALASHYECDFIVTWNCKHLANASMRKGIDRICRLRGYEPIVICTPEELLEG